MEVETAQRGDEAPKPQPFSREALERELNAAQVDAVMFPPGPLLVVAGAGSGKTRVITYRLARLVAAGADPRRILAVTFTNKAAGELRERVDKLLWERMGIGTRGLWVGTFHATAARILRQWGEAVGLRKDFVIYDDDDQKRLLARVLIDLKVPERMFPVRQVLSAIDRAKNQGMSGSDFVSNDYFDDVVGKAYRLYEERLAAANATDFGGLLMSVLKLCASGTPAAEEIGQRFDHVLVDEFQDTNSVQYRLVRLLSRRTGSITVVGDEDQSIYRWRGADIRNILDFEGDHPGARVVKLERNYRSTGNILAAANAIIEKNSERRPKRLYTEEGEGDPIVLFEGETERDEAEFVASRIDEALSASLAPRDFAVFYRTNAQSRVLEDALRARNLPYTVVGGTRFFDRAEIKDLAAYMRAVANPDDGIALQRIINVPARGIGAATVDRIGEIIYERKIPAWKALELVAQDEAAARVGAAQEGGGVRRADDPAARRGRGAGARVAGGEDPRGERLPRRAGGRRDDGGGGPDREPAGARRADARIRTRGGGADAARLPGADRAGVRRRRLRPGQGRDLADDRAHREGAGVPGRVHHRAGGADLPHARSVDDDSAVEEERRLCYVAVTRARTQLLLSRVRRRRLSGQELPGVPSRFLRDLPAGCVEAIVMARPAEYGGAYGDSEGRGPWGGRWSRDEPDEPRSRLPPPRRAPAGAHAGANARRDSRRIRRRRSGRRPAGRRQAAAPVVRHRRGARLAGRGQRHEGHDAVPGRGREDDPRAVSRSSVVSWRRRPPGFAAAPR